MLNLMPLVHQARRTIRNRQEGSCHVLAVLRVCARRTYRCAGPAPACSHIGRMKRGRVCQTQR
jgi:hypothetical protein